MAAGPKRATLVPALSFNSGHARPTALASALVATAVGAAVLTAGGQDASTGVLPPTPVYASHDERAAHEAAHSEQRMEAQAKAAVVQARVQSERAASRSRQRAALAKRAEAKAAAERRARAAVAAKAARAAKAAEASRAAAAARAAEAARARQEGRWVLPVRGAVFTSGFGYRWGRMHQGDDFSAPVGTPLSAMANGVVIAASVEGAYGNKVDIRYADGTVSVYAHMDAIYVVVGQRVAAGERVGTTGNSGRSTGPHLHLEIHPNGGAAVDPSVWLRAKGLQP